MNIDLKELIPRVHAAAKLNGWWDSPRNPGEALMLVISELSEALEADRNGRRANLPAYNEAMAQRIANWGLSNKPPVGEPCVPLFEAFIKDTISDELADAYIRLCDFAGGFGLAPSADGTTYAWMVKRRSQTLPKNFAESLLVITRHISDLHKYPKGKSPAITNAFTGIEALCEREGIDLGTHIDLKLAYNSTRGTRHGGKAY